MDQVSDSKSLLDREASMDDESLFGGPKGAGVGARGRGGDRTLDR